MCATNVTKVVVCLYICIWCNFNTDSTNITSITFTNSTVSKSFVTVTGSCFIILNVLKYMYVECMCRCVLVCGCITLHSSKLFIVMLTHIHMYAKHTYAHVCKWEIVGAAALFFFPFFHSCCFFLKKKKSNVKLKNN